MRKRRKPRDFNEWFWPELADPSRLVVSPAWSGAYDFGIRVIGWLPRPANDIINIILRR